MTLYIQQGIFTLFSPSFLALSRRIWYHRGMNHTHIIISGALFCGILPILASAIDTTTSGRIFDTFKQEEYAILFENTPFNLSGSEDILKNEYRMNGLDGLRKKLNTVQQSYEERKNEVSGRKNSLIWTIASIDDAIMLTTENINKSESSLRTKQGKIQELQINSLLLKRKIFKNRSIIFEYLASIHSQ